MFEEPIFVRLVDLATVREKETQYMIGGGVRQMRNRMSYGYITTKWKEIYTQRSLSGCIKIGGNADNWFLGLVNTLAVGV